VDDEDLSTLITGRPAPSTDVDADKDSSLEDLSISRPLGPEVAERSAPTESMETLELDIGIGLARAEAEVSAAESILSMFESRVRAISSTLARLRALTLQAGVRRPEPITEPQPPPPIDDVTAARARRMLARGGFVRIS